MAASPQAMAAGPGLQRLEMRSYVRPLDATRAQKRLPHGSLWGMGRTLKRRCLLQEGRLHIAHELGVHHLLESG